MTETSGEVEYHPDRPIIHFGSPRGATFYRPSTQSSSVRPMAG